MSTNTKFVQTPAVALYTGISAVATSMRIAPYPVDLDGVKLTMTDFGTTGYCTVDPKVSGYEEIISFTGITDNGDNTATLTGLTRDLQSKYPYSGSGTGKQHGSSAVVVFSDNPQLYNKFPARDNDETITGQWTFTNFPITPATPLATNLASGFTILSVAAANPLIPKVVGDNDPRVPSANPTTLFAALSAAVPTGAELDWPMYTAPTGYLFEDGTAVSRSTYAALFAILCPSGSFTATSATPAVFTKVAHGFKVGDRLHFTGLVGGRGVSLNTHYYVITAGLTADNFEISLTPGGPAINTTGVESGTVYLSPYGKGDGSTTFNLPDKRNRVSIPVGQTTHVVTIDSTNVTLASPSVFTIPADMELHQGQAVVLTTSGTLPTGFTPGNTYYVIRASNVATTFQLASSQALANAGTGINGSVSQSGIHTLTYTAPSNRTIVGRTGGEEMHGTSITELAAHTHGGQSGNSFQMSNGGSGATGGTGSSTSTATNTGSAGGDAQHNNMMQFITTGGKIIKT